MKKKSKVIWFTGLSGSGKSTLSKNLFLKLKQKSYHVCLIDGDKYRRKVKNENNFSKKNIKKNNLDIINHLKKISGKFDFILVAVISPLRITRAKAKEIFGQNYIEIYVRCSLKTLIKRDTKGLYKLAKEKKIKNLIGFNSKVKYETSLYRVLTINTDKINLIDSVKKIIKKIL